MRSCVMVVVLAVLVVGASTGENLPRETGRNLGDVEPADHCLKCSAR